MALVEQSRELRLTNDLATVERIAQEAILREGYQNNVDQDFLAAALAKQKLLGFGGNNQAMHDEAKAKELFSDGRDREGSHGEIVEGQTWNESWYYLASDLITPDSMTTVDEKEEEMAKLLGKIGADEVYYVDPINWNDGKFNFGPYVPEKNPGVFRVWVRANPQLNKKIETLMK